MRKPVPLLAMLLVAAAAPLAAQRLAKPVVTHLPGGITRVMNPGPTAWADTNGWKLVLETTIQPADGSPGELDRPAGIALTGDGGVVEYDDQAPAIKLFDAKGELVRQLARPGEGPGEYRIPLVTVQHDTAMIHDPTLRRGTIMTLDGKLVASFPTLCCDVFPLVVDIAGRFIVHAGVLEPGSHEPRQEWVMLDRSGRRVDSLAVPPADRRGDWTLTRQTSRGIATSTFYIPLAPRTVSIPLPTDRLLWGTTDRDQYVVSRTGRDTMLIFGRIGVEAARAPTALRDSLFHSMVDRNEQLKAVASEGDIPHVLPMWNDMVADGVGNVWIQSGGIGGIPPRFDVYTAGGRYLGAVASPFGGHLSRTAWSADRVAVITTDADGLPLIRVYRIDKRGFN